MKLTKLLALLLAVVMVVVCFAACAKPNDDKPDDKKEDEKKDDEKKDEEVEPVDITVDPYAEMSHNDVSEVLYEKIFGDFYTAYEAAKAAKSVSERYALMAVAEAKLLAQGVMLPSTANGGNYAISRVAPYTVTTCLWGTDEYRFHQAVIVKGNPITAAERTEMKAKWNELKGTGTYEAWAKEYLTGKGYELNDTYGYTFTSDPTTWDAFNTYLAADSEAIVNTYDGLMEYNIENELVPALATGYTVSEDGLKYTFTIREGAKWVDNQGNEIEDVTAQSFVDGFHHMLDAQGGLEYLVGGIIVNASEYMGGEVTDFAQVGVKALDTYKLEYTLCQPTSYFVTMLAYNVFAPISNAYFLAKGGAYGIEEYNAATEKDTYTYGKTQNDIAYCGPYLVKSFTKENSIVFEANPKYWNKDNINIKKINWRFISGDDPTETYKLMKAGDLAGAGLNDNSIVLAKEEGMFDTYAYVSATDATSFPLFFNIYRRQYANYNDATVAISPLSDLDKIKTNYAMQNKNFRLALTYALDRAKYNATTVGDDLATNSLVNSYTPGNFVFLEEDVTIKINGTDTTFKAGTYYGAIMQAQLNADGCKAKVWDPTLEAGAGSSAGYDGWYNPTAAKEELAKAVATLTAQGFTVDKDHPVYVDLPYYDVSPTYTNRANALKQSMEASLDGIVIVNLVKTGGTNAKNWYNAAYYPDTGDLMNFTISDTSGWGPDYGDPATYLDTMLPQGGGMCKNMGLY